MGSWGQALFGNNNWIQGALTNTFNNLQDYTGRGLDWGMAGGRPILEQAPTGMGQANQFLYGTPGGYPGALGTIEDQLRQYGDINNITPQIYQNALDRDPLAQYYGSQMAGMGDQLGNLANYSNYYMQNAGQTDASRQLYDRAMDMGLGQGAQMGALGDVGGNLLGQRGQTAYTQNLQNLAGQRLAQAGSNPALQAGQNSALSMLGIGGATPGSSSLGQWGSNMLTSGGLTPTGQVGENAALRLLLSGGGTPLLNQFQNSAMGLVGQNVVPQNMVSQAMDEAAALQQRSAEAQYRKGLARGGGPGSIVASGGQNQVAAEFENERLAAESAARFNAQAKQMAAQLQQQQLAANYGLQAAGQQQQNLGTSGNLLTGLENLATNRLQLGAGTVQGAEQLQNTRMLQALGYLPQATGAEAQLAQTYGNLGLGAAGQETSNMGLGGNLLNQYNQTRLGALGLGQQTAGLENQMFLGSGGLSQNLYNTGGNLYNQNLQNQLSGQNLGMNQGNAVFNNLYGSYAPRTAAANTAAGTYGTNVQGLTGIGNQGWGFAGTGVQGQSGLWGGQQTNGMFPQILSAMAGAMKPSP